MVLAGGEGKRLSPLTRDRAKPAVPFGGNYRLIDFALSNLSNAGYLKIAVLTQYKSHSLDRHIAVTWRTSALLDNYIAPVPAQMRHCPRWFEGSADAIYQNLNLINDERPDHIIVFGADNIYRMDPQQLVQQHITSGAGVTVAALRVPIEQANAFGVIETQSDGVRIKAFREKPSDPVGLPDAPHQVYASMGNYVFSAKALVEAVNVDARDQQSVHDVGGSLMPMLVERGEAAVYDFTTNQVPGTTERDHAYWRDVGTLDSYYDPHLRSDPHLRLPARQATRMSGSPHVGLRACQALHVGRSTRQTSTFCPLPTTTTPPSETTKRSRSRSRSTPMRAPGGTSTFLSTMALRTTAPRPTLTPFISTDPVTRLCE